MSIAFVTIILGTYLVISSIYLVLTYIELRIEHTSRNALNKSIICKGIQFQRVDTRRHLLRGLCEAQIKVTAAM